MPAAVRVETLLIKHMDMAISYGTSFRRILCFMSRKWDIGGVVDFLCVWHPTLQLRIINFGYYTDIYYYIENHVTTFFSFVLRIWYVFILFNYLPSLKFNTKKNLLPKKISQGARAVEVFTLEKYDMCGSIFANDSMIIVLLQFVCFLTNRYSNFANLLLFCCKVVVPSGLFSRGL